MICPHCQTAIHEGPNLRELVGNRRVGPNYIDWVSCQQVCPECNNDIIWIVQRTMTVEQPLKVVHEDKHLVWPRKIIKSPAKPQVPRKYADDYTEACLILQDSPKASAAIARRCLQNLLRDEIKVKPSSLDKDIQEIIDAKLLPSYLSENIDAIRTIGNFSAHPIKSQTTGEIVEVEENEAEWSLNVLESLFDFVFVQPELLAKKREGINKKLGEAGKPPMK